jgi:hypothetical protein
VEALGVGHGEHLAEGVAFADGDVADHLGSGVTSSSSSTSHDPALVHVVAVQGLAFSRRSVCMAVTW